MTRTPTAVRRNLPCFVFLAVLCGVAAVAQTAEIRVATGPWPDSVPPVQVDASSFSPPFTFIPIDLTLIEETLTVESGFPTITIIGEARNDSEEPAWLIPLTVAGLDADGELVDSAEISMMGGSSVTPRDFPPEWIIPGGTGWFTATLTDSADRPVETILIRAQGMIPNMKSGTAAPIEIAAGLEMAGDWQIEQDGWAVTLNGLVRNTGAGDVVGLRVATAFRDSEGALVELGGRGQRAEVIGGFLGGVPAGGEVPVDLWFYMDPEVLDTGTIDTRLSAFQLGDPEYVSAIVGIGHLQGLGGSTWRSSIDLVNRSGAAARVFLIYRHDGGETGAILDLDDAEAFHSEDVAVELFGIDDPSSGYVLVRSPVPLQIGGRTSNETAVGGYGQALPVVAPEMTYDFGSGEGPAGVLPSLRGGSSFRTNIGLVNFGAEACSAQVVIFGDDGQTLSDWGWVELERAEWRQVNRAIPTDVELAYATIEPEPGCPIWAYASVIEEGTGDPVTVAMERLVEIDLRPSEVHGMVGVIPWTNH